MNEQSRETLFGVIFLFFALIASLMRSEWPDVKVTNVVVQVVGFGYAAFHLIRKGWRAIPFKTDTKKIQWQKNPQIESRFDVWLNIPRKLHRKGPKPKATIANSDLMPRKVEFDIQTNPHGDITIYYPSDYFVAPIVPPDYVEVEVTGE